MAEHDKTALFRFLDYVAERSLLKKETARALKSACTTVFEVLDAEEESDVFALDLDHVFQRFENAKSLEFKPKTMQTYRQRVRHAIAEFERYEDSPSTWRPSSSQRSSRGPRRSESNGTTNVPAPEAIAAAPVGKKPEEITHQFPLRQDAIVQITGIPFDVTRAEMGRMNAFLSNLVAVSEDREPTQLMLKAPGEQDG